MTQFTERNGMLHCENIALQDLADTHGTPAYVYSRAAFEQHWQMFDDALASVPHLVCYAVKANSNIGVLSVLAKLGSGFDIVSLGELERVLAAGGDPAKIVFSGVGKQAHEMRRALEVGIHCFNVESVAELSRLNAVAAELGVQAPVSLRVNPDVDAQTHPYISTGLKENKFGIDIAIAEQAYKDAAAMSNLNIIGTDCHIGSQLTTLAPFKDAMARMLDLIDRLAAAGIVLKHLDFGGGLGIQYDDETPPKPAEYFAAIAPLLEGRDLEILIEPGRAIAGNAGVLLTRVEYLKPTEYKNFAIVDAAMNDLMRPALYTAWQAVKPVAPSTESTAKTWDLVGPICETGDWLAKDRDLALAQGDVLAICSAGAYGFTMASNYNSRPRAVELMVDGDEVHVVRQRETLESLWQGEATI